MALKDLLVCIDPSPAGDTRLKLAFNLARAGKAHLLGAYPLPDARAAGGDSAGLGSAPGMPGVAEEPASPGAAASDVLDAADRAEHHFKNELRLAGIDGEWHMLPDGHPAELIEFAKSVDLTIWANDRRTPV